MSAYIPVDLQRRVRTYFAGCCAYCRTAEILTAVRFEFEHIIPLMAGGQTTFENLCLACPTCNRHKAHRQTATDPNTGQLAPFFHPHQQVWSEHFTWSEDASEIIGLSASGRVTIAMLRMNRPQLVRLRHMWVHMNEHPPK